MKATRSVACGCLVLAMLGLALHAQEPQERRPLIQIAILLDTSGSMSGLISQAKTQLWKIVNELAVSKRDGLAPELQVALYEYGNDGLSADEGWIRQILPLTTDLDRVSEELFALTTNGGSEYCGMVIEAATESLAWSGRDADLKAVFIAGNEPFTQGGVDYREACKAAVSSGIVVNTIHCGSHEQGIEGRWKDGADLADGSYINIDQNRAVVHIEAPQDAEIARLGEELNRTYLAFGRGGQAGAARQAEQDRNARAHAVAGAPVQRAVAKASAQYRNAGWDLVDAVAECEVRLEELKDEDLPEVMRAMSIEERRAYVEANAQKRADIQRKIEELNTARRQFVAETMKKLGESREDTLDNAVIASIRRQAEQKGYQFE